MGLPKCNLHVTNTGDESKKILLSAYKPIKKDDGKYYMPPNTPLGYDMWVPNCLGLTEEEGIVDIEIVESKEETGLWLICYDDYFGDEQHLYTFKVRFIEGTKKVDWDEDHYDESDNFYNSLHVGTNIKMKAGDGPIPVILVRKQETLF